MGTEMTPKAYICYPLASAGPMLTIDKAKSDKWDGVALYSSSQYDQMQDRITALGAEVAGLREALEMVYDKYEEGTACYENPEEYEGFLGNAVRLSDIEEDSILKLIPAARKEG